MNQIPRPEYPRPQFVRQEWVNLNGKWTCELDLSRSGMARKLNASTGFTTEINVPFCPESELSGIGFKDFIESMFYHRRIAIPAEWTGKQILLHFGAVDYECEVFLDGISLGTHFGGSTPFCFDITDKTVPGSEYDLVLHVTDYTRSGVQPLGKQSSRYQSAGCSYTRTTGIWQTVWMEPVDRFALQSCKILPDLDNGTFSFEPKFYHETAGLRWSIRIQAEGEIVAEGEFSAGTQCVQTLHLSKIRPWSPEAPFLYDITFKVNRNGKVLDTVSSYAGLRKIHAEGSRLFLNNKPLFLRLVLDQGFFRKGIWTAPSDDDLKHDIELAMAAGFNGARLHQKVFEPRFHYWADKLGYLTWGESPSWGLRFNGGETSDSNAVLQSFINFMGEWRNIMERDLNHPSIIAWTPLNETGLPPEESRALRIKLGTIIYDTTKSVDPTRFCNDASGFHHVKTDLWTVHLYRKNREELKTALETKPVFMADPEFEARAYHGQPYINDEFGGFLYLPPDKTTRFADNTWGYYGTESRTPEEYASKIAEQVDLMLAMPELVGYCFTQLTDIEQEQNGILTYDRIPKIPLAMLHKVFTGE